MSDAWPSKKEYEAALRNINTRLNSLTAGAGGGEMVYTTAASHTHSGGGAYETVLNVTGKGQAQAFIQGALGSTKYHALQITIDGTVVATELKNIKDDAPLVFGGVWNFNVSLKIEHKSDSNVAICKVAYCCV